MRAPGYLKHVQAVARRHGRFSGNPVACAAVEATLAQLAMAACSDLLADGDALRTAIQQDFAIAGVEVNINRHRSVFSLWFALLPCSC